MSEELVHIRRRLSDEGEKTVAYFESLSPADWEQQVYQTGSEWRVREILAHFVSAERAYQKYLDDVLRGGMGAPDDMDIDEFNESEVPTIQGSPAALIEAFKQVRIDTLELTESLDEADLTRAANHPWFEEKEIQLVPEAPVPPQYHAPHGYSQSAAIRTAYRSHRRTPHRQAG